MSAQHTSRCTLCQHANPRFRGLCSDCLELVLPSTLPGQQANRCSACGQADPVFRGICTPCLDSLIPSRRIPQQAFSGDEQSTNSPTDPLQASSQGGSHPALPQPPTPAAAHNIRDSLITEAARLAVAQTTPIPAPRFHPTSVARSPYLAARQNRTTPAAGPTPSKRPALSKSPKRDLQKLAVYCSFNIFNKGSIRRPQELLGCVKQVDLTAPDVYEGLRRKLFEWVQQLHIRNELISEFTEAHYEFMTLGHQKIAIDASQFPDHVIATGKIDLIYNHTRYSQTFPDDTDSDSPPPIISSAPQIRVSPSPAQSITESLATRRSGMDSLQESITNTPPWIIDAPSSSTPPSIINRLGLLKLNTFTGQDGIGWIQAHRFELDPFAEHTRIRLCNYRLKAAPPLKMDELGTVLQAELLDVPNIHPFVAKDESYQQDDGDVLLRPHRRMCRYIAVGLLLARFCKLVVDSSWLSGEMKDIARKARVVTSFVLYEPASSDAWADGSTSLEASPDPVYFMEEHLEGPFCQWATRTAFGGHAACSGTPMQSFVDAFIHWTYHISKGQRLVCNIKGSGVTITNPELVDLNPEYDWGTNNTGSASIEAFLVQHHCNRACHALGIFPLERIPFAYKGPSQTSVDNTAHQTGGAGDQNEGGSVVNTQDGGSIGDT